MIFPDNFYNIGNSSAEIKNKGGKIFIFDAIENV